MPSMPGIPNVAWTVDPATLLAVRDVETTLMGALAATWNLKPAVELDGQPGIRVSRHAAHLASVIADVYPRLDGNWQVHLWLLKESVDVALRELAELAVPFAEPQLAVISPESTGNHFGLTSPAAENVLYRLFGLLERHQLQSTFSGLLARYPGLEITDAALQPWAKRVIGVWGDYRVTITRFRSYPKADSQVVFLSNSGSPAPLTVRVPFTDDLIGVSPARLVTVVFDRAVTATPQLLLLATLHRALPPING